MWTQKTRNLYSRLLLVHKRSNRGYNITDVDK